MTTAIEGDVVAGAKSAPHKLGGEDFVHPDAVYGVLTEVVCPV